MQLGKLRDEIGRIRETGATVLALSHDDRERARSMAVELGRTIVVLSDPSMKVIYRYGMKSDSMPMADMGYVVIDRAGRIRLRKIDLRYGEHIGEIVQALKEAA